MHKECSKEDTVSANDSSISDSTKHRAKEDDEKQVEEESLENMVEVTETVDSELLIKEEKEEESKGSSEESPEVEGVGVRTRRQKQEMGDDLRGGKRLQAQLKELKKEAERGFTAAERECGDTVSVFTEEEDAEEGGQHLGKNHWRKSEVTGN